jgi:hypothetical protein
LQEIRWVLKDSAGMDLPPPAKKTIDRLYPVQPFQAHPTQIPGDVQG